jgi:hypothetical protein
LNKFAENQRHAALQMLAMPQGIAVLCALPDADFDKLISSTNIQLTTLGRQADLFFLDFPHVF